MIHNEYSFRSFLYCVQTEFAWQSDYSSIEGRDTKIYDFDRISKERISYKRSQKCRNFRRIVYTKARRWKRFLPYRFCDNYSDKTQIFDAKNNLEFQMWYVTCSFSLQILWSKTSFLRDLMSISSYFFRDN